MDADAGPDSHDYGEVNMRELLEASEQIDERLREEFPGAPAPKPDPLGPGIYFDWNWNSGKPGEEASSDIGPGFALGRTHLCGWLYGLGHSTEKPHETDDALVWELGGDIEIQVAKSTGFLTRQRSTDPKSKGDCVLESLELEAPSDADVFAVPESPPEGARVVSAEMDRSYRGSILDNTRTNVWMPLAKWIDAKNVTWDEHSPEKLTRVFRALHAQGVGTMMEDSLKQTRARIDSTTEALAERVRQLAPDDKLGLAALTADRDRVLADMGEQFNAGAERFGESLPRPSSVPADFRMYDVFLECERAAVRAEFKSQFGDPMLALCRERTDALLVR